MYQKRHGRRWFYAVTSLLANLQLKNVHGCTFLGEDGGGFKQQRVLYKTRLFPTYTEVCREKVYTEVHCSSGLRKRTFRKGCFLYAAGEVKTEGMI